MYRTDSILTLGPWEIVGVLLVSAAMALALLAGVRAAARGLGRAAALAAAALLFWLFVWLSPQAYYTYYRTIIDGLPRQSVIGPPPGPAALARLATFAGRADLSTHGKGALFWLLVAAAVLPARGKRPPE